MCNVVRTDCNKMNMSKEIESTDDYFILVTPEAV